MNSAQLSQLTVKLGNVKDENGRNYLPDCVQSENGVILTDLGRKQMINGLRKFDIQYQGDPELQPIRSYENATLVRLLYQLSQALNSKFAESMEAACKREDFLGKFCSYHLISNSPARRMSPVPSHGAVHQTEPRIRLRFLASYRVLLYLFLFYILCGLISVGPVAATFFLLIGYLLYALAMTVFTDKWKAHQD